MSGDEVARTSVLEAAGSGRRYRWSGAVGITEGPVCNSVNCFKSVGGRLSMFCIGSAEHHYNMVERNWVKTIHTANACTTRDPSVNTRKKRSQLSS